MKTAQLTLMMIAGIVILIAAALVIYFGGQATTRRIADAPEHQRLLHAAVQPVKDYITSCLDVTTTTGIDFLTKQGGVIYQHQGGTFPDVTPADKGKRFVEYEGLNVSYIILPPEEDVGELFFVRPPAYPFVTFPYIFQANNPQTGTIIQEQYFGYYGRSLLPPLHRPGQHSFQENLEVYIANTIQKCTQWASFAAQGLAITTELPNATVLIAENLTQIVTEQYLTVLLNWTVHVLDLGSNSTTTFTAFSVSYPIRLGQLYVFVKALVDADVTDARFDPRTTKEYPVVIVEDAHSDKDGGDDIVIAQDLRSRVGTLPLEFRFARHNRPPALHWVNQTALDGSRFVPTATCNIEAPNIVLNGPVLHVRYGDPDDFRAELVASDPDEDIATFHTSPQAPIRISVPHAGADYLFDACANDGGMPEDCQTLRARTDNCPTP